MLLDNFTDKSKINNQSFSETIETKFLQNPGKKPSLGLLWPSLAEF